MQHEGPLKRSRRVFSVPGYGWLWASGLLGAVWFMSFGMAQGWLILRLTDSPLMVGLAPGLTGATGLVFSPFGGVLADRVNRKHLLMAAQGLTAALTLTLGLLAVLGVVQVWHVLVVAALLGVGRSTQMTARSSLTFDVVGRANIMNAMANQFIAFSLASVLGPLAGGFVLDELGSGYLFLLLGSMSIIGASLLIPVASPIRTALTGKSIWGDLLEGTSFAIRDRNIRTMMWMVLVTDGLGFSVVFMLPVVVREVLKGDATALGYLSSLWGLGGLVSSLILSAASEIRTKGWVLMVAAMSFGILILLFSFSRNLALSMTLVFLAGGVGVVYDTLAITLFQTLSPDHMRGRVLGVFSTLLNGFSLGGLGMGAVAEFRGAPFAIALGGSIVAANALRLVPVARSISELSALGPGTRSKQD